MPRGAGGRDREEGGGGGSPGQGTRPGEGVGATSPDRPRAPAPSRDPRADTGCGGRYVSAKGHRRRVCELLPLLFPSQLEGVGRQWLTVGSGGRRGGGGVCVQRRRGAAFVFHTRLPQRPLRNAPPFPAPLRLLTPAMMAVWWGGERGFRGAGPRGAVSCPGLQWPHPLTAPTLHSARRVSQGGKGCQGLNEFIVF